MRFDVIGMRPAKVLGGIGFLAALFAPSGALAAAPAVQAGDADRTVAQVAAYWTPDRMANATPLELVASGESKGARQRATATTSTAATSSPVPYSSFELTDTTSFPNRVHGKVFFTRPGVGNFVCSGTVADAGNRATVITAGHCVYDGAWSTNFAFAPGYRNVNGTGYAPYGIWAASDEAAPQPWVDSENLKFDVGAAVIARDGSGRSLENVVGGRPIAFNQSTGQFFRAFGYPAEPANGHPFDGRRLWACDSNPPILDNPNNTSGPSTMGIGCDMTGGASGGGWVGRDSGYLNGVNSYRYSNQPNLMFGPYFGGTVKALYDFAAALPPGVPGSRAAGNKVPGSEDSSSGTARRATCKKARKRAKRKSAAKRRVAASRACKVASKR
jgi:hypothetical protein